MSTTPMRIIGLTGLAGTGKDTVRRMLEEDHGFEGLAFADPLRDMIGALLTENSISTIWMYDRALKEAPIDGLGVSYRRLAQTLGTEWGRHAVGTDLWVNLAEHRISVLRSQGARAVVISDVRFLNEAAWIHTHGGEVWRIHRSSAQPVAAHISESELLSITADRNIDNNGTVEDLWCQVSALAAEGGEA
jgi:hypothetical protein